MFARKNTRAGTASALLQPPHTLALCVKGNSMEEVKTNLYPCKHCNETGTCTSGKDGTSCLVCVKAHKFNSKKEHFGLVCGTCSGTGQVEPKTERLNRRARPILSILIVYLLLVFILIFGLSENQYFNEFLVFAGTIIGSVTAFYFGNAKNT